MELGLLAVGLFLLVVICILLIVLIRRRDSGGSVNTLLASLRDGQETQERLFRDELGRIRTESATIAREPRGVRFPKFCYLVPYGIGQG